MFCVIENCLVVPAVRYYSHLWHVCYTYPWDLFTTFAQSMQTSYCVWLFVLLLLLRYVVPPEHGKRLERLAKGGLLQSSKMDSKVRRPAFIMFVLNHVMYIILFLISTSQCHASLQLKGAPSELLCFIQSTTETTTAKHIPFNSWNHDVWTQPERNMCTDALDGFLYIQVSSLGTLRAVKPSCATRWL